MNAKVVIPMRPCPTKLPFRHNQPWSLVLFHWNYWISGCLTLSWVLFAAQNITQEKTKFGHVVPILPAQYASEVCNIILRPPEAPYTALKTESQNHVCPSKRQRSQQLLHMEDLGDWKPSNFYGVCWSFAEVQSPTLPMMRFFVSFSLRNFHSPFAQPLQCTKMPASVCLPTWRTTWRKSKVLKHQFINSSTRVILKLLPLKPSFKRFGKPPVAFTRAWTTTVLLPTWYLLVPWAIWCESFKCHEPCKFQKPQGNLTASWWRQPTWLAPLPYFTFMTRILSWIFNWHGSCT